MEIVQILFQAYTEIDMDDDFFRYIHKLTMMTSCGDVVREQWIIYVNFSVEREFFIFTDIAGF